MGKKPAGGWLATVRKVFKPASKDLRYDSKQHKGGGEAAEVVSIEHCFPAAETSPEVTNDDEGIGGVVWLERDDFGEVVGARRRRNHRGLAAASSRVVVRMAAARGMEQRAAAVRIQAFYRGYLARRALRALRALVRLQALVRGHQVRRQVQRTMRCMQALVRAQDRVRACRLPTPPNAGSLVVGGRRSFGHDGHEMQARPPRRSNNNVSVQEEAWVAVRADGTSSLRQRDAAGVRAEIAPTTCAYEFQHRRQQHAGDAELLDKSNNSNAGWHWTEGSLAGVQPRHQHWCEAGTSSYVTAATTVEMEEDEAARNNKKSPTATRDLYPVVVRPPAVAIPGYMAATQSARAKARIAPPPAAPTPSRAHAPTRPGSARLPQQRAAQSPESSCSGDRTPVQSAGRSRLAFA